MTIIDFCKRHSAGIEDRDWALAQGVETMAELWELPMRPEWRIWIATREGVLTLQQRVAFACRFVRHIWHLLKDERSRTAVETAERWAIGEASNEELATARSAASTAASAYYADSAAYTAAAAVESAADSAAYSVYAAAAAYSAAAAVESAADSAADYSTERDWQAQELVNMFGNPFRKET